MIPAFLLLLFFFSLTAVPPAATEDGAQTDILCFLCLLPDSSSDVSEIIARANEARRLTYGDIRPNLQGDTDPCTTRGCKWPKRGRHVYVPVSISSSYTKEEGNVIIRGLLTFHQSTCVRFVWRRWWHPNFIYFYPGTGCWSNLGRQRRGQAISLKKDSCLNIRTVQHEVLHALGFHHEQVRLDRDRYVSILTENIQPGKESNFAKVQTNNLKTPYDFNSVMHYSNFAFSRNGRPTIIGRSDPNLSFGLASEMSTNDIARINKLYQC